MYWQGGLYASQSGRGLLTVVKAKSFFGNVYWLHSICCAICANRDGYSRVCVFPAGFGSNFRIMVGSASGPGSIFNAFLGSTRVRVPLSNKIRVRVGSAQHIYGSLRVRVRIFGPVKSSGTTCEWVNNDRNNILGWTIPLITVGSMYSRPTVPLRPAPIKYTGMHPFLSAVYFHFRHNQLSLYINLVCFVSISTKDNLVQ